MAHLDPRRDELVVRLVYDGPALAGKTTTLRALGGSLGRRVFAGAEESGRTLHLDWVDYVGGLFEGMPIRCQVVGVPGQRVLWPRRRYLLTTADVVVFVADSRPERMEENRRSFAGLGELLQGLAAPVAVIVQANKRDAPDALSLEALRDGLGGTAGTLAMTESVASAGDGIRETFVLAVRLALDRVRLMMQDSTLRQSPPEVESGEQLVELMLAAESGNGARTSDAPLPLALEDAIDGDRPPTGEGDADPPAIAAVAESTSRRPRPPDASVPPGLVWPPVSGRVVVHEASRGRMRLERAEEGGWLGLGGEGWRLLSPEQGRFLDLEAGRRALIEWARWHSAAGARLSPQRAIVLAAAEPGAWRLWQVIRRVPTLVDVFAELAHQHDATVGAVVFHVVDLRLRAEHELVEQGWVPAVTLDTIAASPSGEPVFAGFAPFRSAVKGDDAGTSAAGNGSDWARSELAPLMRAALASAPARLPAMLNAVDQAAAAKNRPQVAHLVRQALLSD